MLQNIWSQLYFILISSYLVHPVFLYAVSNIPFSFQENGSPLSMVRKKNVFTLTSAKVTATWMYVVIIQNK